MFNQTDHELAPWHLVSGEQKRWARITVIETLIERIEQAIEQLRDADPRRRRLGLTARSDPMLGAEEPDGPLPTDQLRCAE